MNKSIEFFQDSDGRLSMTRLSIFMLIVAYIAWATYIVQTTHTIPDIPTSVAALMGSLYMFNQELLRVHIGQVFKSPATPAETTQPGGMP